MAVTLEAWCESGVAGMLFWYKPGGRAEGRRSARVRQSTVAGCSLPAVTQVPCLCARGAGHAGSQGLSDSPWRKPQLVGFDFNYVSG